MKNVSVSKYLSDARAKSNKSYANANGNFDVNPSANNGNVFANMSGNYGNASGNASGAPTSQPYIINITSTSAAAVTDFEILGSNSFLYANSTGTWTAGSLVVGSITISSGTPGVTYQQLLSQIQQQPFLCAATYYASATTNQVQQTIQVKVKDANGNEQKSPMVPSLSPYQFQSGVIIMENAYTVNGNTSLVIASVLANSTITLKLYPAGKIDLTTGLAGNPVSQDYSAPAIVKAQPGS